MSECSSPAKIQEYEESEPICMDSIIKNSNLEFLTDQEMLGKASDTAAFKRQKMKQMVTQREDITNLFEPQERELLSIEDDIKDLHEKSKKRHLDAQQLKALEELEKKKKFLDLFELSSKNRE